MIRGGLSFNFTRRIVNEFCRKADIFIISNSEADFEAHSEFTRMIIIIFCS